MGRGDRAGLPECAVLCAQRGRFITRDAFHGLEDDPASLNQYNYAHSNPVMFVDPSGHLVFPAHIHNAVVNHIWARYQPAMLRNKRVNYTIGFGFIDLVNSLTGEIWEVKRRTVSVGSAYSQIHKYITGRLADPRYASLSLRAGGFRITSGSLIFKSSLTTYYVSYWNQGGGLIQYDYYGVTDWSEVGNIATGVVIIGGAAFAIILTKGAAAPVLAPLLAR